MNTRSVNPDNPSELSAFFRQYLKPALAYDSDETLQHYKDSLRYFLVTHAAPFSQMIEDQWDSPLRMPSDPYRFYFCLWQVLFPNEPLEIGDLSGWTEDNDPGKAVALRRNSG